MDQASILVTGATQRVGLHLVHRLLESGHRVAITYRREKPVLESLRQRGVLCLEADFTRADHLQRLQQQITEDIGPLRALVHNASLWPNDSDTPSDPVATFQEVMAVHAQAPYLLNLHCEPLLRQGARVSDIVHITDYVVEKGSRNHIAYAASKAALANLTRSFAQRFAPHIKVNNIAPSLLMFHPHDSEAYREKTLKKSVLGIEPGPEPVWQALQFILDNPYMTGRDIALDGGRHVR